MKIVAEDIMKKKVISVHENISMFQLQETFFNENISGAPVVDEEKRLIGIVSKTDVICSELENELHLILNSFMSLFSDEIEGLNEYSVKTTKNPSSIFVKDIMTRNVLTVKKDTPVTDIVSIMLKKKIHRVVVVEDEKVVGLISSMDILPLIAGREIKYGG